MFTPPKLFFSHIYDYFWQSLSKYNVIYSYLRVITGQPSFIYSKQNSTGMEIFFNNFV